MDRDKEEGHFERQAMTMDVIDTYIVENAMCRVEISEASRERILASEVTRCVCVCACESHGIVQGRGTKTNQKKACVDLT